MFNRHLRGELREEAGAGEGGGGAAFDPAAFEATVMANVTKMLNGIAKKLPTETAKLVAAAMKAEQGGGQGEGEGQGSGEGEGNGKGDSATKLALANLTRQLAQVKPENEENKTARLKADSDRLEEQRLSLIRTEVAAIPFRDDASRQLFFDARAGKVKRDEDGNLIAETDKGPLSYKEYLKAEAEGMPHLLAPKGGGGAGASTGRNQGGAKRPWTLDDVALLNTDKLTATEKTELRGFLSAQYSSAITGHQ